MYNRYCQSQKNISYSHQSTGFIRNSSPNKFRSTMAESEFSQLAPINRLRNSFSSTSISYFKQINSNPLQKKQERKILYDSLKNALDQIENRIKCTKQSLQRTKFSKKKIQLKQTLSTFSNNDSQNFAAKQRETVSTEITHLNYPNTKISQFINSQPKPLNYHQFISNPYDSRKYNLYYVSEALRASNQKNSLAMEHINGSIKMIKSCAEYYDQKFNKKSVFKMDVLPKDKFKKTLVLDLDQTIIHCYQNIQVETDLKLCMTIQDSKVQVGVNIRPYAMTFLRRMAKKFQIVIFTASHEEYANAILDQLDPTNQIISHRLYRQHCIVLPNELHVKDLRYLNRDLKDVVLVDNAAYSYSFQLQNGIPILPYYEGKDYQLPVLQNYLEKILQVQDVRQVNKEYFKLQKYKDFQSAQQLVKDLYSNKK